MLSEALKRMGLRQSDLAERCGVSEPTVSRWVRGGSIPAERVLTVEKITGVPRHVLRPDVYPAPVPTEAA